MEIQDILNDIYSEYVSIKVGQNNLIVSESEAISANFTDKIYSPDELYQVIKRKKEIISSDKKFVYGELRKLGVETLFKEICELNSDLDTFVDVGSGNGKICLHLSLISDFESIVGIEIVTGRHLYSVELLQSLEHDFSNVTLLNDDIMSIEFERPCVVFTNDVCFPVALTKLIFENLPVGSHFITSKNLGNSVKEIYLNVTWQSDLFRWYYYIKN